MKSNPDTKVLRFNLDKYQGAAAITTALSIPGYRFQKMERTGEKVTVTFTKEVNKCQKKKNCARH